MAVTAGIDLLTKSVEPYTATASIGENGIDKASSKVTGDRTSSLFSDASSKLGKDDFLLLLVKQLQYQDPLNPMENTEFISQLAQFTALENSTNVEKAITELGSSFKSTVDAQKYSAQSMNNTAAVSLIGKQVRLQQTELEWYAKTGERKSFQVHIGNQASAVVEILNSKDEVVRTLETTNKDKENSSVVTWDGVSNEEKPAPAGKYKIRVQGADEHPELYAFQQDVVEGVRFGSSGALVKIAGQEITIANILDVSGSGGTGSTGVSSATAVALLGKQVRMKQGTVSYNQVTGERALVAIAAGNRSTVQVAFTDATGREVFVTAAPVDENGIAHVEWNGLQTDGTYAKTGEYRIALQGAASDPSLFAFREGKVTGISNLNGDTRLRVGGYSVPMSAIIDIADTEAS